VSSRSRIKTASDQRSFTMVYNDFLRSKLLEPNERLIYIYLKMHSDSKTGQSFPSLNTLAKETGISKRTVQRCIEQLQEKGALRVVHRKSNRGNQSNLYTIYDTAKIWNAEDISEMQSIASEYKDAEMIAYLQEKGYQITKKELVSETDQSPDTSASSNNLNIVSTTNNSTAVMNECQERYSMDDIRELFDYEVLKSFNNCDIRDIDTVMEILYDTLNTSKTAVRVSGENKPAMVVIGRLMKLTYMEIQYAIEKYNSVTERIKNPKAYMLTILYGSREQMKLDITNQVQHDFYGTGDDK